MCSALLLALLVGGASGCGPKTTRRPAPAAPPEPLRQASLAELVARYNRQAEQIESVNASVRLQATTGSRYTGVIRQYRRIDGFLLAERPDRLRLIGDAPVIGTHLFDLAASGGQFSLFVPAKNKFFVGSMGAVKLAGQPLENLRPQHLLQVLFWTPIGPSERALLEEEESEQPPASFYVVSVIEQRGEQLVLRRRIWFNRAAELAISRLELFGAGGKLEADIHYDAWKPLGALTFPQKIVLRRPIEAYQLTLEFSKLTLNVPIPADRFRLTQPPATERVVLDSSSLER